ncbi:MAG: DUF4293 domain-containing protein [Muribaculaceae bacterium]|nr:DUF4293 domain-containing protein [Muribaculaceae bacterium]MDE6786282.1 DUF4293 domain-containing protein [Muribaculaceae bacterium]
MVIQRWQSVMLLIAGVMMGIFSFCSLGQIQAEAYTFNVTALGICREGIATAPDEVTGMSTIILFIVSLLGCIMPLIDIFCFKNMPLQKKVALISALISASAGVIAAFTASGFASDFGANVGWSTFICAPLVALIANILAFRLISSDQKKLRAADRLR